MGGQLSGWPALGVRRKRAVCRRVHVRTASRDVPSEGRGDVKWRRAAREMLRGWGGEPSLPGQSATPRWTFRPQQSHAGVPRAPAPVFAATTGLQVSGCQHTHPCGRDRGDAGACRRKRCRPVFAVALLPHMPA